MGVASVEIPFDTAEGNPTHCSARMVRCEGCQIIDFAVDHHPTVVWRRVLGHIHNSDAWFPPEHHHVHTSLSTPISPSTTSTAPRQSSPAHALLLRLDTLAHIAGLCGAAGSLHELHRRSADIASRPLQTPEPSPLGLISDFEAALDAAYQTSSRLVTRSNATTMVWKVRRLRGKGLRASKRWRYSGCCPAEWSPTPADCRPPAHETTAVGKDFT